MKRFTVPIVTRTLVVVDAEDLDGAITEATRIVELGQPQDEFLDGWNDVQRQNGAPIVESVDVVRMEPVDVTDVTSADVPNDQED
jgi:hypothetical protein